MKAKYITPFTDLGDKHLEDFETIPTIFRDEVFMQAFEEGKLPKFGENELDSYERSLKYYRDLKGVIDTAYDDGKIERSIEMAVLMKQDSEPIEKP